MKVSVFFSPNFITKWSEKSKGGLCMQFNNQSHIGTGPHCHLWGGILTGVATCNEIAEFANH